MAIGRMLRVFAAASVLAGCALLGPAVAMAAPEKPPTPAPQAPDTGSSGQGNGNPQSGASVADEGEWAPLTIPGQSSDDLPKKEVAGPLSGSAAVGSAAAGTGSAAAGVVLGTGSAGLGVLLGTGSARSGRRSPTAARVRAQ